MSCFNQNPIQPIQIAQPIQVIASTASPLALGVIAGIPASTPSTIVTYTASTAKKITRISVSGTDYAKFLVYKNTSLIETQRTGPDRNLDFIFTNPLDVAVGDIIDIKVIHYAPGNLMDFESTIYGV